MRPPGWMLVTLWGGGMATACGPSPRAPDQSAGGVAPPESEAPVALNGDSPIGYPPALFDQRVEGDVVLRLFVDSTGRLVPESTRVAETSGYPALDSAALAGAPALRFAPAKRRGIAVATAFLQPIEFRHPSPGGGPPAGTVRSTPSPTPAVPRARAVAPGASPQAPPPPALPRDTTRPRSDTDTARTDTNAVAH